MSKSALGKGIDALFGENGDSGDNIAGVNTLHISRIYPAEQQPRKNFSKEALQELADSIKEKGVLQPIIVRSWKDGYQIVAGERRFRAAGLAGLEEIPVIISEVTEEDRLEIALIENIQREDLTPVEEAEAYKNLIETLGLNQDEIARKVGKKRSTVANSLRLLKLPVDMRKALDGGEISAGHARAILAVVDPAGQKTLFKRICSEGLSVREAESLSAELNNAGKTPVKTSTKPAGEKSVKDADLADIEQKFIDSLGTRVQIRGTVEKGKIEINYFSRDDLERVYDLIVK
ncbi:MAG: ParB/RepB/Spo0J family partition protein [Spirochaetales bacterium]|nr:ParB/RepB/Spo0J family partition protein [Spirochaetales bacterium]